MLDTITKVLLVAWLGVALIWSIFMMIDMIIERIRFKRIDKEFQKMKEILREIEKEEQEKE